MTFGAAFLCASSKDDGSAPPLSKVWPRNAAKWARRYQQHGSAGLHDRLPRFHSVMPKPGKRKLQKIKEAALLQSLSSMVVNFLRCQLTDWI